MSRQEGILMINGDEFYPVAHSDNNFEVITDTYARKEINNFTLSKDYWAEKTSGTDKYYEYEINETKDPRVKNVKETDNPIWDIQVDPTASSSITYKEQIKYRAWITTLLTFDGSIKLVSMGKPGHDVLLTTVGLRLNAEES